MLQVDMQFTRRHSRKLDFGEMLLSYFVPSWINLL